MKINRRLLFALLGAAPLAATAKAEAKPRPVPRPVQPTLTLRYMVKVAETYRAAPAHMHSLIDAAEAVPVDPMPLGSIVVYAGDTPPPGWAWLPA